MKSLEALAAPDFCDGPEIMDLRELVRADPRPVVGHLPVAKSLNLRNEMRRFRTDPLVRYVENITDTQAMIFRGDTGRYLQGFGWYSLCLGRALEHCSVARRWNSDLRWHPAAVKYSDRQKTIAAKQREIGLYQELDLSFTRAFFWTELSLYLVVSFQGENYRVSPHLPGTRTFSGSTEVVVRKYSVLTEILNIFTRACKVCIHDEDVAETDFEHTFEIPKGFRSGFGKPCAPPAIGHPETS